MQFGRSLLERWHLDPTAAFLNHGSFGAAPKVVLEAQTALREALERQPVRFMEWAWHEGLAEAAAACAPFLGARPEDLAFVDNATTGINAVMGSYPLQPGDVVLTTDHAYGAVRLALEHHAARCGARVEVVAVPFPLEGPEQVIEAVAGALHDRVRIAVLDWITAPTGVVLPIRDLVDLCHAAGVAVLVDGAHVPGHLPCDLDALGADWFVGNAHKWLFSPKGSAFLHARADRQADLHAPVISWGYGQGWQAELVWTGTRDPTPWLATPAGLSFLDELEREAAGDVALDAAGPTDFRHVRAWCTSLREDAATLLTARWKTPRLAPASMLGHLCALELPVALPPDAQAIREFRAELWDRHRVEVPIFAFGDRCLLRISAQVYNDLDDYARLADAIGPDGVT